MSSNLRNPLPPADDTNYRRNMSIWFLKPSFSLKPLGISVDMFSEKLFISPPVLNVILPSSKGEVLNTTPIAPDTPQNLRMISLKEIYEPKNDHLPKKQEKSAKVMESSVRDGITSKRSPKLQGRVHKHKTDKKERHKHKTIKKEQISEDECSQCHENSKHERKETKVHSISSDSEEIESSKPKKRHKGHTSDKSEYRDRRKSEYRDQRKSEYRDRNKSEYRDRNKSEYRDRNKSEYRDRGQSEYKDGYKSERKDRSESEDCPNNALDSTRTSRTRIQPEKYKEEYPSLDYISYPTTSRYQSGYKGSKDGSDSDRSISRGSAEFDGRSRYFNTENDITDSDGSNSRRSESNYNTFKTELADGWGLSESYNDFEPYQNQLANFGPDKYYCKICQLDLNGEATFMSHMNGKKHLKAVKAQIIPEIVKESLSNLSLAAPLRGHGSMSNRIVLNEVSKLETSLVEIRNHPIMGLENIEEIRTEKDTQYFCNLCDAPCMAASIVPHLIGFKHQMNFMKMIDPRFYDMYKDHPKKSINGLLRARLFRFESLHGRGKITVTAVTNRSETTVPIGDISQIEKKSEIAREALQEIEYWSDKSKEIFSDLDANKNDYYCKTCDSHMNNVNMWSAHLVGKRHLKNAKKKAGERNLQVKGTRAPPGTPSKLEALIAENHKDIIVGLDYIRETQSEKGSLYTCYLCGSSSSIDIVDHLVTMKHRIKYLETVNENGKLPNQIQSINELEVNQSCRENLVSEECEKIEKRYGRGRVEVYLSKF